ncbi:MAG TPA: hypothetical protein VMU49_01970 [Candidatus Acidoferrales bacterium]|nr:hypothetical protein [Candidatus Acidoferrales bacterium]
MSKTPATPPVVGHPPTRPVAGLGDPFANLESASYPELALTAYLPGSTGSGYEAGFHARVFAELAHTQETSLSAAELAALRRDLPDVLAYLEMERPPREVSLVLFSCAPAGLLECWRFHGETDLGLWVRERLHLDPLRYQLEVHSPALVLLVDKEKARAYSVVLDHVEEVLETTGREIHVQREGGASALNWQHKEEEHASQNLDALIRWLEVADDSFINRVFVAGPDEPRSELLRRLPQRYASKVKGELHLPMYETPGETAERIRGLLTAAEHGGFKR